MTRMCFGLLAIIATSACSPSTQLVGDDRDEGVPNESLMRLGEDVSISVIRDEDWCEGEEWTLWVENSTLGVAYWDEDPLDEGDSDALGSIMDFWEGDIIFINGGCSDDANTWLVEDDDGFRVNIESIEIDDLEYDISDDEDDEDAAPEEGTCVKRPHHNDLVCRLMEVDEDAEEYCLDDDDDGYGDPDECGMYEPGDEPRGWVDNDDDCDDGDDDVDDECVFEMYCDDDDGDGYGDPDQCNYYEVGDEPSGYVDNNDDCDDQDEDEHDDCDSDDEEREYCDDDDGDGYGDPDQCAMYEEGDEPNGYVDNDDDCDDQDEDEHDECQSSSGDEVEIVIEKDATWCDGDQWQVWLSHNDYYEDEELYDLEVSDPDDADELSGELELEDGEYYRLQGWCDHDNDNNVWDGNTWLIESTGEHVRSLEIDGRTYSISTAVDATPSAGACTRPSSTEWHLICNIDL